MKLLIVKQILLRKLTENSMENMHTDIRVYMERVLKQNPMTVT